MNNSFVYKGVRVYFDDKIGYFIYMDMWKMTFENKARCLNFISGLS
jgi:hypothetical protein